MREEPALGEETVGEVLSRWPEAARAMVHLGMACPGCPMAPFETIREMAAAYRRAPETLVKAIREAIAREERDARIRMAPARR